MVTREGDVDAIRHPPRFLQAGHPSLRHGVCTLSPATADGLPDRVRVEAAAPAPVRRARDCLKRLPRRTECTNASQIRKRPNVEA